MNDKNTHSFARPEEEAIHPGEGRTNLALLRTLRPGLQDGNLQEAYLMAKSNNGAPGIDGVTFETIEESGVESFLKQIQDELPPSKHQ